MKSKKFLPGLIIVVIVGLLISCRQTPSQVEEVSQELSADEAGAVTLRMFGPAPGAEFELNNRLLQEFAAETGIEVELVAGAESATDRLNEYLIELGDQSDEIDVYQIDVIWPGILADHLVDLNQFLAQEAEQHFPAIIENNTVEGHLVGMPFFTDAGLLYYRTDLLEKYGFAAPPQTWEELEQMAQTIQEGERAAGNEAFWGYVWQGKNYEGLTCNALEWQASHGGGRIIEAGGGVDVNNQQSVAAFDRAAGWIGTISPEEIIEFREEEARRVWQAGNAAFMRNWPYAYALGNSEDSPIKGQFEVSLLPDGGGGHAATLGGWQLAVSKYSKHPQEAVELIRFLTSPEIQLRRSIEGSFAPTIPELYEEPAAVEANPYYTTLRDVFFGGAVARPSAVSGEAYAEVSFDYFTAVHSVLTGEATAEEALVELEAELSNLADFETERP